MSRTQTKEVLEIPRAVLESVDTLDELEDWLMARNPAIIAQLRQARKDDLAGNFRPWKPHHTR
ncbi:MAG: hypothetical protein FJ279_16955 [Planctomycetes bacterium]|nr:hypothetical protein [Planctomycetota bacterium]